MHERPDNTDATDVLIRACTLYNMPPNPEKNSRMLVLYDPGRRRAMLRAFRQPVQSATSPTAQRARTTLSSHNNDCESSGAHMSKHGNASTAFAGNPETFQQDSIGTFTDSSFAMGWLDVAQVTGELHLSFPQW